MSNEVMSPAQQGLNINPILTSHAQGFRNAEFVGDVLFPRVPVASRFGQIMTFGKESFKLYNARRAPGSATKRINVGYAGLPYALVQDSLEAVVPRENQQQAQLIAGIDLAAAHVDTVMQSLLLGLEYEQAELARNPKNYVEALTLDAAGAAKWSSIESDPIQAVADAREAVRQRIGQYPNKMVLGARVFAKLKNHPKIVDRLKYTQFAAVNEAMLAELFELAVVKVAKGVIAGDDDSFGDIWGDDAILAYVPLTVSSIIQPSFGYTYTLNGNPLVEESYFDKNAKSDVHGVTFERAPVITGKESAYLFKNLV